MRRALAALFGTAVLVAGGIVTAPPAGAAPKVFKNCTAVNQVYPGGIAKKGVKGNTVKGYLKAFGTPPRFDTALYNANKKMDRDKDGIACEK